MITVLYLYGIIIVNVYFDLSDWTKHNNECYIQNIHVHKNIPE